MIVICTNFVQKYGQVTSGPIFIYWTIATVSMIPTFASIIIGYQSHYNNYPTPFFTLTLQLPIIVALFFLNFFSDAKPKYIDLEGKTDKEKSFMILLSS